MQQPKRRLNKKGALVLSAAVLIVIVVASLLLATQFLADIPSESEFYYGVEVAYGGLDELKAVVDETKTYTNLVIFGVPEFTKNQTLLNLGCDYAYDAGLHFIVLLTNQSQYTENGWEHTSPQQWAVRAQEKYGDKFLAVYRWDEPGGDQIDHSQYQEVKEASDFADAAEQYMNYLQPYIKYYQEVGVPTITADYVLHWFDYKIGYDTVLAEFGWNNSREQQIALVRGAARANDKAWGAIVTWEYSQEPYIESPQSTYGDLVLAYDSGARYAVVFNYPEIDGTKLGTLTQEHFNALKDFHSYVSSHPPRDGDYHNVKTAYVLPADYGFGFRYPQDSIWGLWPSNNTAQQIYNDVDGLIAQQSTDFDVICEYPNLVSDAAGRYNTLIYWNGIEVNP